MPSVLRPAAGRHLRHRSYPLGAATELQAPRRHCAGHVKVMDFGLATQTPSSEPFDDDQTVSPLTASGIRMGAPGYMSPEQVLGGQADERSDIFAFGILSVERGAHRLFHGSRPFGRLPGGAASSHADRVPRVSPRPTHFPRRRTGPCCPEPAGWFHRSGPVEEGALDDAPAGEGVV